MKIEEIQIKNYKVFKNVCVKNIPNMAVFLGKNGSGKSTFFDVFGFLHDALEKNIQTALQKRGGFKEVITRGEKGSIQFVIKFRPSEDEPLITYELEISLNEQHKPVVLHEVLRFRRGQTGAPWKILEFKCGEGFAADGELKNYQDVKLAKRKKQRLRSPDILAIKGLGQFKEFSAISTLRELIEDWYVSNLRIDEARSIQNVDYSERISTSGDNLAQVAKFMYDQYPDTFNRVLEKMRERVPGVKSVEAKETDDGRIVLRFLDGDFKDPFVSRFVSDGTIKMFTYLLMLNDPEKHALLCIEEPENFLYPSLLAELVEEFRLYAVSGGQVFVSTHSPDLLNAVDLDELYCLEKKHGCTTITCARDILHIRDMVEAGDSLGQLWRQGLLV